MVRNGCTPVLAVDCDGVLLDWIRSFAAYASKKLGRKIVGCHKQWGMNEWLGVDNQEVTKLIEEFNASDSFGKLRPCYSAQKYIPKIAAKGWRLAVVTSAAGNMEIKKARRNNLRRVFGDVFNSIVCLPLGVSKFEALTDLDPTFWVEDNYSNAIDGHAAGHTPIMIRTPYNYQCEADDKVCIWRNNWQGIVPLLG